MKLRLILIFILLFQSYLAFSEIFVVTSNADNGAGTLREALTKAAANGNAEVDYINFNMPGNSIDDHTISILSELPEITSDIVIDASTQPGQEASVNHAKVIIDGSYTVYSQHNYHLFSINGVDRFELYGMVIKNFLYTFIGSPTSIVALDFSGINKNVTIGAPGKGNVIYNIYGINMDWRNVNSRNQIINLTLKNNFFGIKENGLDIATTVLTGIFSKRNHNVIIGGDTTEEGNLIYGSVEVNFADINELVTQNVSVLVKNNIFTANMNAERPGVTVSRNSIVHSFWADANLNHTGFVNIEVTDNVYGAGLGFRGLNNCNIRVSRNFFGTSRNRDTSLPIQSEAIRFYYVKGRVLVGGSSTAEGNVITNTSAFPVYPKQQFAISAEVSSTVELSHNILYCNPGIPFLYSNTGPFNKPLEVLLKEKTATYVAGTTKPGARVELYYTDPECTNCQPKRYFATVIASPLGNWRYDGIIESGVSVMASATVNQVTSEFSDPRIYMFPYNEPIFKITHQTCEGNKGKIQGAFTVNADKVEWLNEAEEVVGNTHDLENLAAGKYKLRANQFGCIIESEWVIVEDHRPQLSFNATAQLIHPSCGNPGSILSLFPNYFSTIQWLNENDEVKGTSRELIGVPPGAYTLRLTGPTGCVRDFGPYVLVNAAGPSIDQSTPNIKGSSCNTPTGYIKNIQVTGSGTLSYKWRDAAGAVVGSDKELLSVSAGLYTLEVKDESACPAMVSSPIIVHEINGITINTINKIQNKASCNNSNGSITGITVTGATDFEWLDAGGTVVASSLNLTDMPAGKYRLVASNAVCNKTSEELIIELAQSTRNYATTKISTPASCGLDNGKIEAIFTNDQPVSCFWKNNAGIIVGNSRILENQGAGPYNLYVIDDLGCEHFLQQYSIGNLVGVTINRGFENIQNDECGMGKGRIRAPGLSGGQLPYFYEWKDVGGRVLGSGAILDGIKAGVYQLTVGDALACSRQTISYTINNESGTLPAPVINDLKICAAGDALIQVLQPVNGKYLLYNEGGSVVDQNNTGTFKVNVGESQRFSVVLRQGSCESLASSCKVTIENDGIGKLANALSPNNDGVNDQWVIPGMQNYPEATVSIYNRYGNKVFESTGYKIPFNGRWNGSDLPIGTYYYIIDLKRGCGLQKGSLTLVR
ncbi:MAG: gliding motility-associated C-terminal domain-containing protein [Candidatus Pedobacter colombiensis]|uniref:Gliding motility-associated C-terminal domain-containing protein n=1 Tax=Candidatus Pedobacter colombiensis TaxID=3121371 RepID=A0AAJ6B8Q0_9SPHI|nr:gliding motility-associated C-terminal domain-containing protein [Pedobacter sp.]WEK21615.1 MAG: gliding motility-associated C-terminal domain-containing protein [Pedobacter sp.]